MASKLISTTVTSDNNQEGPADKMDGKFVKKSYPRPWQVELTDEEIEVLVTIGAGDINLLHPKLITLLHGK